MLHSKLNSSLCEKPFKEFIAIGIAGKITLFFTGEIALVLMEWKNILIQQNERKRKYDFVGQQFPCSKCFLLAFERESEKWGTEREPIQHNDIVHMVPLP